MRSANSEQNVVGKADRGEASLLLALVMALAFISAFSHTPMSIYPAAGHDDGLFMRLGMHLARPGWLGAYDQTTLAKGPGYPIFLAINSWSGLPISVAHAVFHCLASGLFAYMVTRASGSRWLGLAVLFLLLWNPLFLTGRVVREAIYTGQILIVYGLASYSLFLAGTRKNGFIGAIATGLFLGWCWLTREEGLLLLPGIAVLVVAAFLRYRKETAKAGVLPVVLISAALAFLGTQVTFRLINLARYGSFIGVDLKDSNFQAALEALQSVKVGERIVFLPVPRSARQRIYEVSPAFSSLKGFLDPPNGSPWQWGCGIWKWTCGDIASGWFIWALRDAAAANEHYRSPSAASEFFATLAAEVKHACETGELTCERSFIPYMPMITKEQLSWIPDRFVEAMRMVAHVDSLPLDWGPSSGTKAQMEKALAFLNYPVHSDPPSTEKQRRILEGWYFDGTPGWFSVEVRSDDGTGEYVSVERKDSRDLEKAFKTSIAARHRFTVETQCEANCRLVFSSDRLGSREVSFDEVFRGAHVFSVGTAGLYIDKASNDTSNFVDVGDTRIRQAALIARAFLDRVFRLILPAFMICGAIAFCGIALVRIWVRRLPEQPVVFAMAGSLWVFVVTRMAALVLIAVSSFPAVNHLYMSPAIYIAPVAAALSVWMTVAIMGSSARWKGFAPRLREEKLSG
jgi:hypothetical protein